MPAVHLSFYNDMAHGGAFKLALTHPDRFSAADQEDFVSMGLNTALKNGQILDNAYGVLGIEFMAAAQALDFRKFQPGKGTQCAREVIRKHVEHLHVDRPLYNDHNAMKDLVKSGEILNEVEKVVGELR